MKFVNSVLQIYLAVERLFQQSERLWKRKLYFAKMNADSTMVRQGSFSRKARSRAVFSMITAQLLIFVLVFSKIVKSCNWTFLAVERLFRQSVAEHKLRLFNIDRKTVLLYNKEWIACGINSFGMNWNQRFHELSLWLMNCTWRCISVETFGFN